MSVIFILLSPSHSFPSFPLHHYLPDMPAQHRRPPSSTATSASDPQMSFAQDSTHQYLPAMPAQHRRPPSSRATFASHPQMFFIRTRYTGKKPHNLDDGNCFPDVSVNSRKLNSHLPPSRMLALTAVFATPTHPHRQRESQLGDGDRAVQRVEEVPTKRETSKAISCRRTARVAMSVGQNYDRADHVAHRHPHSSLRVPSSPSRQCPALLRTPFLSINTVVAISSPSFYRAAPSSS